MKRYLLFTNESYEACGGFNDFKKSFDSVDEAQTWIDEMKNYADDAYCNYEAGEHRAIDWDKVMNIDHWHIFDCDKREVVLDSMCERFGKGDLNDYIEER